MNRTIMGLAALMVGLLAAPGVHAGPATDVVKARQEQLFKVVAEPKGEARQARLNRLFDELIAYDVFASRSLGDKWSARSAAEKKRFTELLTELVRANYRKNIQSLLDFDVRYANEASVDGGTSVTSLAKHKTKKSEPEVEVEFRLETIGGQWKVVDIVTEKSSMVKTFRSQFVKVLNKDGFDALIGKMQKKLDKLGKG